ncbi:GlsB/YeaQ/YmgE family stress response membrane protein [Mycobacterium sp. NPDC050041]|uniref:GlsB/YeaQ/YmgE family stress response membrane protein n=1 Tax=Mycobacterium sp. NPDC050041 TaxID=3364293 RepID=UPI003C2E336F
MFWTIISAIIGGLIIGALARLVMPGKQNIGVIMTIVLGVLGSFIGSWACYNLFGYQNEGGGWAVIPFIVGIIVAAVLIAIYLAVTGRKTRGTTVR